MDQSGRKSLIQLEDHVSYKSIADHDVSLSGGNIPGLDIADKIDAFAFLQKGIDLLDQSISLLLLRADIDERDTGILNTGHILHVDGAHLSKLDQLGGTGIHVGAAVHQKNRSLCRGHKRCQRRALDPADPAYQQLSAGKCCSRAACSHKGITGALFDQLQASDNRRILFFADRVDRRLRHLNNLPGIQDLQPVFRVFVFCKLGADDLFLTHKRHMKTLSLLQCLYRSLDRLCGSQISAHRVYCNSDIFSAHLYPFRSCRRQGRHYLLRKFTGKKTPWILSLKL